MENRKRNIQMKFYVTEEEKRLIDEKMKQLPIKQYGAYFRKMAIDGYIQKRVSRVNCTVLRLPLTLFFVGSWVIKGKCLRGLRPRSTTYTLYSLICQYRLCSLLVFPLGVLFAILRQSSPCLVCHHQQHFLPFALLML